MDTVETNVHITEYNYFITSSNCAAIQNDVAEHFIGNDYNFHKQ